MCRCLLQTVPLFMYGAQFWLWNPTLKFNSEWWVLSQSWNMVNDSDLSSSQIRSEWPREEIYYKYVSALNSWNTATKQIWMLFCPFTFIDRVQPSFYHEESSSRPHYHTFGEKKPGSERNTDYSRQRAGECAAECRARPCTPPDISSAVWAKRVSKKLGWKVTSNSFCLHGCLCLYLRRMLL